MDFLIIVLLVFGFVCMVVPNQHVHHKFQVKMAKATGWGSLALASCLTGMLTAQSLRPTTMIVNEEYDWLEVSTETRIAKSTPDDRIVISRQIMSCTFRVKEGAKDALGELLAEYKNYSYPGMTCEEAHVAFDEEDKIIKDRKQD